MSLQRAKERAKLFGMAQQQATIGGALRLLRKLAKLTLEDVAEGAGTSIAYLSKVERDQLAPTDEYVAKITGFTAAAMAGVTHD